MAKIKKIAIAGCGGLGSNLAKILYDYGVNRKQFDYMELKIDQYDSDHVEPSNLLVQDFTIDDLGKSKVQVIADKYPIINPIERFMEESDFKKYDLIFSAVDSMAFRKSLYEWSWANPNKVYWIDGRCESKRGILVNSSINRSTLENFIDDSNAVGGCLLQHEKDNNISHTLPIIIAASMVQLFLNKLRGEEVNTEKVFFF